MAMLYTPRRSQVVSDIASVRYESRGDVNGHAQHTCCRLHAGAQGNDATVVRYVMPGDSGYVLQQDAVFTLPIQGGGAMDIAAATNLLWMALNSQVMPALLSCISGLTAVFVP